MFLLEVVFVDEETVAKIKKRRSLKSISITVSNLETITEGSLDTEHRASVSPTPK